MSSDEYALALAQKYRLALSMAVLNTKPENLTINEYINEIRDVIIERNKDASQQDSDMTACSDDFNIDDDEIMTIDFPHDFNRDQDVKSVSNDPGNYINNRNRNKLQHNERQIDNDCGIDDKLTHRQVNDKAVRIHLNEDDIKSVVIGTQDYCSQRQFVSDIKQYNGNKTQDTANNQQNDGNIIRSYEKYHEIGIRSKVNSKGIAMSGDNTQGETEKSDRNKEGKDKFREVIRILKGVDVSIDKVVKDNIITSPGIIKTFDPTDLDLTQCYDDRNDTFLHMDSSEADCQNIHVQDHPQNIYNYDTMRVCNSITTSNVPDKDKYEAKKRKTDCDAQKHTNTDAKLHKITKPDDIETVKINPRNSIDNNTLYYATENSHKETNNKGQNEVHFAPKTTILDHKRINHKEVSNNTIDGDNDPVGVMSIRDTQFNTHFSESQMCDIVIDKSLIYGNRNQSFGINAETNKVVDKDSGNTNQENTEHRTISIYTHTTKNVPKSQNVANNSTQKEFAFMTQSQEAFPTQGFYTQIDNCTENGKPFDTNDIINTENNTEFTIDILLNNRKTVKDLHKDKNNVINKQIHQIDTERENLIESNTAFLQTQDMIAPNTLISTQVYEDNKKTLNTNNDLDTVDTENENDCTAFDKSIDIDDEETTEKVPFKILEEMNQIKTYLSKKREFKDSGYKSSQSQRSGISTQPSSARVSESADSVFIYLTSCPLDLATQDLTEQISEVLGQIIDKLHEEEIYPKFLEELLHTVEKLLHSLYEEESYDFDVLQKKDEQIQRIILLNKSSHINKFTIEKINNILQKLINEISDTNYEIQEINKLENLCYIFHILQIILPKYIQGSLYNSQQASQTSQNSQEPKVLKKQDISDIWRRKWFTNTKENETEGSLENKCVLKECSAILNKIIVDFIDGYSLIAFSALKCFNLIQ